MDAHTSLVTFAGPIGCLAPGTEKDAFAWGAVLSTILFFVTLVIVRLAIYSLNRRKTLHDNRSDLLTIMIVGMSSTYLLLAAGWSIGGTTDGGCNVIYTSAGGAIQSMANVGIVVSIIGAMAFLLWFKKKGTGQRLVDIRGVRRIVYSLVTFYLVSVAIIVLSLSLASIIF